MTTYDNMKIVGGAWVGLELVKAALLWFQDPTDMMFSPRFRIERTFTTEIALKLAAASLAQNAFSLALFTDTEKELKKVFQAVALGSVPYLVILLQYPQHFGNLAYGFMAFIPAFAYLGFS